ncbi:universal stress protein [Paenisporosarcina quisquiliarum]|uniref:Universal stress protein n=1 Tax=Paenisporosarcina quisquiliarum TaxID=365346 RepID=A0A9X3LI65_9BACL|nr:universal stress protein [Paenisporosarcina quisquiliarum]
MYQKILLAADGSNHSVRATGEVIKIASLNPKAIVTVVLVADYSQAKSDVLHSGSSVELDMKRRKKLLPVEELLKNANINYRVEILHGVPGPAIVEFANKQNYELLVIGSRGLNSLQEMVLGSVSHKVVKRVECPVLVVK